VSERGVYLSPLKVSYSFSVMEGLSNVTHELALHHPITCPLHNALHPAITRKAGKTSEVANERSAHVTRCTSTPDHTNVGR
jgi:hypothetical protein